MMITTALVFAGLAALLHVYIFVLESLRWTAPRTRAAFGTTVEQAEATRVQAAQLSGQLGAIGAERDRLAADLAAAQQQIGRLTSTGKPGTGQ